ncbi:type II secretion system F family protein [Aliivibrio sp. S4TY2]|uniref:type II secretion system F family protein n=1 Tax=unclassified Aliivibrio TaxID=2645654 RepID=UPI002378B230|nr:MULTISPECIES: type II secretion system F family protein [unclassified Aliivibrio]MDD9158198.1 type II secretion system F family protein [Aliivibrio sp. S4TY2]MDD9162113.1 type II secretion system F family protein [Aliivibrio sp. S4TY1]MDD9166151.1 type II secretion system F family protein [Aliivibrio sp. S4MY2]MDD9170149.1 type II secretion system F family protein [Aliivibrio sp. S4MY4]MDD9187206.1 type II secretion system F family protein [Aliivibrio sp. S4MY3]
MVSPALLFSGIVSLGCLIVFWLLSQKLQQKKAMRKYLSSSESLNKSINVLDKVDQLLPSAVTTNNDEVERKFYSAGFYDFKFSHIYMPIKYAAVIIGCSSIYWSLNGGSDQKTIIAFMCMWLVFCISVPDGILNYRIKAMQDKLSNQLPYLLDLLAMCVHTGMTLESSLTYLAKEMQGFDKDLAHMVSRTNDRARIVGLAVALDELYVRVPTNEMRSFVMTLKQSLHYGSSIYSVLNTLAGDIRQVRLLALEEKVGKLAAKMSVPLILFIMIPVVILIAAPGIMRMMTGAY